MCTVYTVCRLVTGFYFFTEGRKSSKLMSADTKRANITLYNVPANADLSKTPHKRIVSSRRQDGRLLFSRCSVYYDRMSVWAMIDVYGGAMRHNMIIVYYNMCLVHERAIFHKQFTGNKKNLTIVTRRLITNDTTRCVDNI